MLFPSPHMPFNHIMMTRCPCLQREVPLHRKPITIATRCVPQNKIISSVRITMPLPWVHLNSSSTAQTPFPSHSPSQPSLFHLQQARIQINWICYLFTGPKVHHPTI